MILLPMILPQAPPPSPVVGAPAPDVAFRRPDGSTLRLSSLEGKIVVLEFTILVCPPCRTLAPRLEALAARQPDVVVLTVCVDTPEATAELLRQRPKGARTVFVSDPRQTDRTKTGIWKFGNLGYPSLFVIGKDGTMASRAMVDEPEVLIPHVESRIAWARKRPQGRFFVPPKSHASSRKTAPGR